MTTIITLNNCSELDTPNAEAIQGWVAAATNGRADNVEISIRIVGEEECADLNARYRGKRGSTNVLSFPADLPDYVDLPLLGDIIICAAVVEREAREQNKQVAAHWAHMAIHGALHLLGYGHATEQEASAMEAIETELLISLDFPPPYEICHHPGENSQRNLPSKTR
jgi:probable rRNA maturation factor